MFCVLSVYSSLRLMQTFTYLMLCFTSAKLSVCNSNPCHFAYVTLHWCIFVHLYERTFASTPGRSGQRLVGALDSLRNPQEQKLPPNRPRPPPWHTRRLAHSKSANWVFFTCDRAEADDTKRLELLLLVRLHGWMDRCMYACMHTCMCCIPGNFIQFHDLWCRAM